MNRETPKSKFRLDIEIVYPFHTTVCKYFNTLKIMRQWQKRNDLDRNIYTFGYKELTKNKEEQWELFTVISKKILTVSQLKKIIHDLEK
jgi:hypothetical protein